MDVFIRENYPDLSTETVDYLSKRICKACELYSQIHSNPNLYSLKLNYMRKKILDDRSLLTKIKDGKLRVKECLNTSLYEYSTPLQVERQVIVDHLNVVDRKGSSNYKCPKCGKRNHTENQVMTRAGDEATSIKCVCLECTNTFWA